MASQLNCYSFLKKNKNKKIKSILYCVSPRFNKKMSCLVYKPLTFAGSKRGYSKQSYLQFCLKMLILKFEPATYLFWWKALTIKARPGLFIERPMCCKFQMEECGVPTSKAPNRVMMTSPSTLLLQGLEPIGVYLFLNGPLL